MRLPVRIVWMLTRGFRRLTGRSEPMAELPDLAGRVCVVTGASSGIGAQTARGLAQRGARVVLVGRNPERTAAVAQSIRADTGNPQVRYELSDFGSLVQVAALADRLLDSEPEIHVLVNNAGLWHPSRQLSADGFEDTLAVNHLATFLLTRRLLPRLESNAPARVVTVSSRLHETCVGIDFEDPFYTTRTYRGLEVYAQSKLANVLIAHQLARTLRGTGVSSTCVHPGDVATDVVRDNPILVLLMRLARPLLLTPWEGAQTTLYAAASEATEGVSGAYFSACEQTPCAPQGRDDAQADELWRQTEAWVAGVVGPD